jgi:hypothetical protein
LTQDVCIRVAAQPLGGSPRDAVCAESWSAPGRPEAAARTAIPPRTRSRRSPAPTTSRSGDGRRSGRQRADRRVRSANDERPLPRPVSRVRLAKAVAAIGALAGETGCNRRVHELPAAQWVIQDNRRTCQDGVGCARLPSLTPEEVVERDCHLLTGLLSGTAVEALAAAGYGLDRQPSPLHPDQRPGDTHTPAAIA